MHDDLVHTLVRLSERGRPRGAAPVLAGARRRIEARPPQRPVRRTFAPGFVVAAVVLVTLAGLITLQLVRRDPTSIDEPAPVITAPPETTVTPATGPVAVGAADDVLDLALAPEGRLWAATAAGVVVWDLESSPPTMFSEADGLGGRRVEHVAVAADGTAWAIGDSWLAHYDGAWTLIGDDVVDADLLTPAGDMAVGPDGAVWVAAGGPDALLRVDIAGATTYQIPDDADLATPWARSIAVDPSGTVWASTWQSGVLAFDGEWHRFGIGDGLPSDIVGNVAVAPDGTVWVGADGLYGEPGGDVPPGGILRYRDGTWTTYTTVDGLLADGGSVAVAPDGDVWVVHSPLPEEVAAAPGVESAEGISHFDGTAWRQYPGVGGRGPGVATVDGRLWLASPQGIIGFDGATTTHLTTGPAARSPVVPAGQPVHLRAVEGLEPVRLATSIGEIEFTTWVHPDGDEPPWFVTETDHGVIGGMGPDAQAFWSLDGITWTEMDSAAQTGGWSDRSTTNSDDLVAWSVNDGVGRAAWDGEGWAEVEILGDPRLDGAREPVAGPQGIVVVRGALVYAWDGTDFAPARRPPDASLHPGSSPACAARQLGWNAATELGPVVATDDGFIALTARNEDDWHSFPVCEPLVWFSPDGDHWTPTSDESPFGAGTVVRDVSVAGGRIVAVGGSDDAAAWVSEDGITWQPGDLDDDAVLRVTGSARGWIAVGRGDMWFSSDGLVWDGPYERPPGWGDIWDVVGVAMFDDRIIGVGELRGAGTRRSTASGVVVGVFVDE